MTDNIVKHACEVLGITQAELAKRIGASKPTVERWAQSGEVSDIGERVISLLIENEALKRENAEIKGTIRALLKHAE